MSVTAPPPVEPRTTPAPPVTPPRRGPSFGAITLGAALIVLGLLGFLAAAGVEIPAAVVGPTLLIVIGLGVAVAGVRGERDGGLLGLAVFVGVVVLIGSVVVQVLDVPLRGAVGDRTHAPSSITELEDDYRLLMGQLTVDLRDVEFPRGTTELEVSVVMGEVVVLLPDDVGVEVDAGVAAGSAVVLGRTVDGMGVDNEGRSDGYDTADRRLSLRMRVGLGEARV